MENDYIIIDCMGHAVDFEDSDIVIYGDYEEAFEDLSRDDMGLVKIEYSKDAHGNDTAIVSEPARYHKLHGVFTFDDNSENEFQTALKKFLEEKPFTER
ncbi:MAG: hypothetical protein J6X18_00715 [Bacteroidales bacterium]|nr:hypothetical protein [Bacteroidales bacterium]